MVHVSAQRSACGPNEAHQFSVVSLEARLLQKLSVSGGSDLKRSFGQLLIGLARIGMASISEASPICSAPNLRT